MEVYEIRVESFSKGKWPHPSNDFVPTPQSLASAGFFFKPKKDKPDRVTCFICKQSVDGWKKEDIPLQVHLAFSPECAWAFVNHELKKVREQGVDYAQSPQMKNILDARAKTFSVGWPHSKKRGWNCTPSKMSKTGFYFNPTSESPDNVSCMYCGLSLDGWEKEDDPNVEHKKRASACLIFGKSKTLTRKKAPKNEQEIVEESQVKRTRAKTRLLKENTSEDKLEKEVSKPSRRRRKVNTEVEVVDRNEVTEKNPNEDIPIENPDTQESNNNSVPDQLGDQKELKIPKKRGRKKIVKSSSPIISSETSSIANQDVIPKESDTSNEPSLAPVESHTNELCISNDLSEEIKQQPLDTSSRKRKSSTSSKDITESAKRRSKSGSNSAEIIPENEKRSSLTKNIFSHVEIITTPRNKATADDLDTSLKTDSDECNSEKMAVLSSAIKSNSVVTTPTLVQSSESHSSITEVDEKEPTNSKALSSPITTSSITSSVSISVSPVADSSEDNTNEMHIPFHEFDFSLNLPYKLSKKEKKLSVQQFMEQMVEKRVEELVQQGEEMIQKLLERGIEVSKKLSA